MTINLSVPQGNALHDLKPRITVIGVGGAGGNAVNNMINAKLEGVEFVVANTDSQALSLAGTERRLQLGSALTQGLGAGAKPDIGRAAAEESMEDILEHIKGSHMAFIAAGMGGGTGTGAAPVIARAARDQGVLTVGVVTKPFQFEGPQRMRTAEKGIEELEQYVDTLIIIPNQNLFRVATENTTFADAFTMADDVLYSGVRGVTDLMIMPGLINLDFADVRTVMSEMGKAMMGTGEAAGERRALDAAEAAISNPLLDDTSMAGAKGVLINITGGMDMTLFEVDEAANRIRAEVDPEAYIIFGSTFDAAMEGSMRVSVVATGIDRVAGERPQPKYLHLSDGVAKDKVEDTVEENASPVPLVAAQAEPETPSPMTERPVAGGDDVDDAADIAEKAAQAAAVALSRSEAPSADGNTAKMEKGVHDVPHLDGTSEADFVGDAAQNAAPPEDVRAPFIPPAPVGRNGPETVKANPFAEAAMHNGALEPTRQTPPKDAPAQKPKAQSLFELVTGSVRNRARKDAPRGEDGEQKSSPPSQPMLGGLDPDDRLPSARKDEDLLEIPAFLRRQAN
ncbi:cell division protein FtsZ [Varunaivibrio sulfuroxidans]|uniref:Cell division protein FtsZ n=1 Tax=Varunaivibrio sulfuroxidans TaxID=1773489 RepID=A0A4R3JC29_9PROT|nr:cell division protein FtsZ [Varunaivibrio sulfuroxidans]TCS62200.1 cell division protein FtsZ [Varunaivibrio sulfuroxidans]WES30627.1 cell division protein FtsZ [Varunaivibrio sulfuroxidans]